MEIRTIGFTKWSAAGFFGVLREAGVRRLIDVRLGNTSQLAAFAKRDDLEFFLRELVDADYLHVPSLAPEVELLRSYRRKEIGWADYEQRYLDLLAERSVETHLDPALFSITAVLLCSEHGPERCHRRLAAEYLAERWPTAVEVIHL